MSKGNMLLGQARGKVGSLVFSRVNGQQVTRSRAEQVKNPKTEAQMIQRILLNTVIQAYSRMSEITDHSFENVPTGQPCMSQFMRRNLNLMRNYLSHEVASGLGFDEIYAFAAPGTNQFTMNPWIIATGSLPAVTISSISAVSGAVVLCAAAGTVPTYAEVINALGLQRGDQLTFVGQEAWTDGRAAFKFCRVILDPRDNAGQELSLDVPFLDGSNKINSPSPRNENTDDFTFTTTATDITFNLAGGSMFGASVIVSRQRTDGTWLRSNAQIVLDTVPYTLVQNLSMQEALDMAYSGVLELGSERYLNNASRASRIAAGGGSTITLKKITKNTAFPTTDEALAALDDIEIVDVIIVGDTPYAVDANGNRHFITNANSYSNVWMKSLVSATLPSTATTASCWSQKTGESAPYNWLDDTPGVIYIGNSDVPVNDNVLWFANQGLAIELFANAV